MTSHRVHIFIKRWLGEVRRLVQNKRLPSLIPSPGDPVAARYEALARKDPTSSIIDMGKCQGGGQVNREDGNPIEENFFDAEIEIIPPIRVWNVRSDRDGVMFEAKVSWAFAEWLGRVGAVFWPLFGEVEEQRKNERLKAARKERMRKRFDHIRKIGRLGYLRQRRAETPTRRKQILDELVREFDEKPQNIELFIRDYKGEYLSRLRKRRNARICRRNAEGVPIPDIATNFRLTQIMVKRIVRESK